MIINLPYKFESLHSAKTFARQTKFKTDFEFFQLVVYFRTLFVLLNSNGKENLYKSLPVNLGAIEGGKRVLFRHECPETWYLLLLEEKEEERSRKRKRTERTNYKFCR